MDVDLSKPLFAPLRDISRQSDICEQCLSPDSLGIVTRENYDSKYALKLPVKERGVFVMDLDHGKLTNSAEDGCAFCDLLYRISKHVCSGEPKTTQFHINIVSAPALTLEFWWDRLVNRIFTVQLYRPLGQLAPWNGLQEARAVSGHSGSDECFSFARNCIRNCTESHEACRQVSHTCLPKRVLDVGQNESSPIQLVENQLLIAPYLALSHCWGDQQPLKTTSLSLQRRKQCIEWDDLPPVFQDAITVTRRLGLQYLWIDSLCILQDSTIDWEEQSAQMGRIYSNAYITIAAASSSSASEPFLALRHPLVCDGAEFEFRTSSHQAPRRVGIRMLGPTDNSEQVLHYRAWTLQEELLSTRILRYTSLELKWECRMTSTCECGAHSSYRAKECINLQQIRENFHSRWPDIVEQYSNRTLSFPSDKLPALAGIAAKVSEKHGFEYLAGIWKESIIRDLAWRTERDLSWAEHASASTVPHVSFIAPSFSWASMTESIVYKHSFQRFWGNDCHEDAFLRLENVDQKGQNPFGEVTGGFIILEAPVIEVVLQHRFRHDINGWYEACVRKADSPPEESIRFESDGPLCKDTFTDSKGVVRITARRANNRNATEPFECIVMLLSLCQVKGGQARQLLVLSLPKPPDEGCERIGILDYYGRKLKTDWFSDIKSSWIKII